MGYQEDYDGDLHKSYQDQIDNINYLRELEADRIRNETNNIIRQQEAQKPVLKQRFTDNAQDAYIRKMKSQKELPQILSAQGYNGGLTESSNIKLDADYGNSYNGHQRDYNTGLREVDSQINTSRSQQESMLAQNSANYGQMLSNANATYQQALAQAKREQRAQELQQQQYQQEFAYKQQQDKIKNDLAAQKAGQKSSASAYKSNQAANDKKQKDEMAKTLKLPSTQNFIKAIEAHMPNGNVIDPRTGKLVTPEEQIAMSLEQNYKGKFLTWAQVLAIAQQYGLEMG